MGYIRLLLACVVLIDHCGGLPAMSAWAAVEAFFTISGFYMALTFEAHYRGPNGLRHFYASRAVRLYPLYFCILALMFAAVLIAGSAAFLDARYRSFIYFTHAQDALQHFSVQSLLLQDMLSLDAHRADGLPVRQGWSLSVEIVFYALLPWLVSLSTSRLCLIVGASFALKYFLMMRFGDPWAYLLFAPQLSYFICGILTFRFRHFLSLSPAYAKALVAVFLVVAIIPWDTAFETHFSHGVPFGNFAMIALLCALMPSALNIHFPWGRQAGDLSYGVYLMHMVIIEILRGAGFALPRFLFALSVIFICILLSHGWETLVQRPLDTWRRRIFHSLPL